MKQLKFGLGKNVKTFFIRNCNDFLFLNNITINLIIKDI